MRHLWVHASRLLYHLKVLEIIPFELENYRHRQFSLHNLSDHKIMDTNEYPIILIE